MGILDKFKPKAELVDFHDDDIRVLHSYVEYTKDRQSMRHIIYEMELLDHDGNTRHLYKAIKLLRILRIPKSSKEDLKFMEMTSQVLSGLYSRSINWVVMIANMIHPVPLGLLHLYGVQATADTVEEAMRLADNDFAALEGSLVGTYKTMEFRNLNLDEVEWLREKMFAMKHLTVVRGIPEARKTAAEGSRMTFGGNSSPSNEGTAEDFVAGMSGREYVLMCVASSVSQNTLNDWRTQIARDFTFWSGQHQGTRSISAGVSLPFMFASNLGENSGWSHADSSSHGLSHSVSEGVSHTVSDGVSQSSSVGQSIGSNVGENIGTNVGQSHSFGQSANIGSSTSASVSDGVTQGYTAGITHGVTDGTSHTVGSSHTVGQTESTGLSQSVGYSQTVAHSHTDGTSASVGYSSSNTSSTSHSEGSSLGHSIGSSTSDGTSQGQNWGKNHSDGQSVNASVSGGISAGVPGVIGGNFGASAGVGATSSDGSSSGVSFGQTHGTGTSEGYSGSNSTSDSSSSGHSDGFSSSRGVTSSDGVSVGNGVTRGTSVTSSRGLTDSYGSTVSDGTTHGESTSQSFSRSLSNSHTVSQGVGTSAGQGVSASAGSTSGASQGQSWGLSQGQSSSQSVGSTHGVSNGTTSGTSDGTSTSTGTSSGTTGGIMQGTSASGGVGPSLSFGKSYQWVDQEVAQILQLLEYQSNRLMLALSGQGAFFVDLFIATPDEQTKASAQALARTSWVNEKAYVTPLEVMELSEAEESHLLYHFNAFSPCNARESFGQITSYRYSTVLLANEAVAYSHPLRISEGGIFADVENIPILAVPSMRKGEIYIGKIVSGERWNPIMGYKTPFDFRLENDELHHGLWAGESRSGKTEAALRFAAEVANKAKNKSGKRWRILALDPKKDWRRLARFVEPERFRFYSLANFELFPVGLNLCKIPRGVYPQFYCDALVEVYCRAYGLAERGRGILTDALSDLYDKEGVFVENWREVAPERSARVSLHGLYERVKQMKVDLEDPSKGFGKAGNADREAVGRVLERLKVFDRHYSIESKLFGQATEFGIDDLLGQDDIVVLESYGLESTFRNFVFGLVTSGIFQYAQGCPNGFYSEDQYPTIVMIEEANEVLVGQGGGQDIGLPGTSQFEKILDQAAGLGILIHSITQKPSDMPPSVIANSGLVFAGKLSREEDLAQIVYKLGRDPKRQDIELLKWFPRSPIGHMICRSSRNFDFKQVEPSLVSVDKLDVSNPTDDELRAIVQDGDMRRQFVA